MSPLRIGTLLGAVATTSITLTATAAAHATGYALPVDAAVLLTATTAALWAIHAVAVCRDQVMQRLTHLEAGIGEYGDERATAARLSTIRKLASEGQTGGEQPARPLRAVDR